MTIEYDQTEQPVKRDWGRAIFWVCTIVACIALWLWVIGLFR